MNTRSIIALAALIAASLACSPTYAATVADPTPTITITPTTEQEPASGAVYQIPTPSPRTCARVTAYVLHMRDAPSGTVIHWLYQDQIITVREKTGEWWKVEAYQVRGYAHSAYLQPEECRP
jgi:hypothetical protein